MFRKTLIFFALILAAGCMRESGSKSTPATGLIGENEPITRAEACAMAALNRYSLTEIDNMDRTITFEDTSADKWYDKYINAAFSAGIIAGTDEQHFDPEGYLTLRQAQFMINKIKGNDKLKLRYDEKDRDKPIPYSIWTAAFERSMDTSKLRSENISVYATKDENRALGDSYILTSAGLLCSDKTDNREYKNRNISAILRDNTIVAVKGFNEGMAVYENAEITDRSENSITVQLNGGTRKFTLEENSFNIGDRVQITFDTDGTYDIKYAKKTEG